jgi:hypothetical protein
LTATRTGLVGIVLVMRTSVQLDGLLGASVLLGRNARRGTNALHGMTGRMGGVPGKSGALSVGIRIRRLGGLRVRIGLLLMSGGIVIVIGGTGLRLRRVAILLGLGIRMGSLVLLSNGGGLVRMIFRIRRLACFRFLGVYDLGPVLLVRFDLGPVPASGSI